VNLLLTEEEKSQLLDALDDEQARQNQEDDRKKKVDEKMTERLNEIKKEFDDSVIDADGSDVKKDGVN